MIDPKDKIIKGLTDRVNELEAQLHDALLAEREACANLCEEKALYFQYDFIPPYDVADSCAESIRARSKHD